MSDTRNATKEELLELSVEVYNMAVQRTYDKKYPDKINTFDTCKHCGRYVQVISCICPDGEFDFKSLLDEVRSVSEQRNIDDARPTSKIDIICGVETVTLELAIAYGMDMHKLGKEDEDISGFRSWLEWYNSKGS